jgi:ATP-dependent DNA helicase PIF1
MRRRPENIEINEQFEKALRLMEDTSRNVFVTGRAGTGKSTLLQYFRERTKKRVALLAPTGVAALNIRGQTIHSFFGFKPDITPEAAKKIKAKKDSLYRNLDALVVDEISMVRADLLDCMDVFLRRHGPSPRKPFGGLQMIFIGDLYQLPPVVTSPERAAFSACYRTPYFFSARVFEKIELELVELEKIYRQHDPAFIALLNGVRNKEISDQQLGLLNSRVRPDFEPGPDDFYVYLVATNRQAEAINNRQLEKIDRPLFSSRAYLEGDFGPEYLPTYRELNIKPGAQVMLVNNDSARRWVNGSIGRVLDIIPGKGEPVVVVRLSDGDRVEVLPFTWEIFRFHARRGRLESEVIGTFTQYPLTLAWAVTIHKAQGKTFERAIIDIGRGTFAHGQVYVALSRCTSFEGLVLKKPIARKHIWMDWQVADFLTRFQYRKAEEKLGLQEKIRVVEKALADKFSLEITYLKTSDVKTRRVVVPLALGEMEYGGKTFLGLRAFCLLRGEERTFRLDRILEMKPAGSC